MKVHGTNKSNTPTKFYNVIIALTESWSEGRELCVGVFLFIICQFLLGNLHFCLPRCSSTHWFSASIPDEESEATRIKRFQICCRNHLHFKHHTRGLGTGDVFFKDLHQHWHWDKCNGNFLINDYLPCPNIHSKG